MTSLFQSIFGGGTTSASEQSQAAQVQANLATEAFIREQTGRAREDVLGIFPEAQAVRGEAFQNVLQLIGAGVPAEAAAFTQGNIGAQNILAQTPGQVRNALLGLGVTDFQPVEFDIDTSFLEGFNVADAPILEEIGGTSPPPPPPDFGRPPQGGVRNNLDFLGNLFSGGSRERFGDFPNIQFDGPGTEFVIPESFNLPREANLTNAPAAGVRPDIFGTPIRLPTLAPANISPITIPPNLLAQIGVGRAPAIRRSVF